jgi:hypothetical protein
MGLTYYFSFTAPTETTAGDLERFLKTVERKAKTLGFEPTMVLDATFDTPERKEFARRLVTGYAVEDDRLKGVVLPMSGMLWHHDQTNGTARVIPTRAVVLVLTDEHCRETIFGFFKYPAEILDVNGKQLVRTGLDDRWISRDFVDSPDPRFRIIVAMFAEAGFLETENDEYAPKP